MTTQTMKCAADCRLPFLQEPPTHPHPHAPDGVVDVAVALQDLAVGAQQRQARLQQRRQRGQAGGAGARTWVRVMSNAHSPMRVFADTHMHPPHTHITPHTWSVATT